MPLAQGLVLAQTNGWLGHDDAAGIFAMVASMFGREVMPAAEPEGGVQGGQDYTPDVVAEIRRVMQEQLAAGSGQRARPVDQKPNRVHRARKQR
jgi:hypothetical protein